MTIVSQAKSFMMSMGASPVMYLMLALSVVSLAVIFERAWFFFRIGDDLGALSKHLDMHLEQGDLEGAERRMKASRSAEAAVVLTGLRKARAGAEAADEVMVAALAVQRMKLERGLAYLGTLGANAPFLGLFGTVIGIIMAFEKLGEAGSASGASAAAPAAVMSSIAEALVATAIGLAVAIPAVTAYNYFQRRIKSTLANTDALTHVLLAWLKSEDPAEQRGAPRRISSANVHGRVSAAPSSRSAAQGV